MTYNKEFRLFIRFLKEHNAYKRYVDNLQDTYARDSTSYYSIPKLLEFAKSGEGSLIKSRYLFAKMFTWSATKEGDYYWRNLHTEWVRSFLGISTDNYTFSIDETKYPIIKRI